MNQKPYPFVKWAGGKRKLVSEITKFIPLEFNRYYEPFVGGGALFYSLGSRIRDAHLSDINADLINAYKSVCAEPEKLIRVLKRHSAKHCKEHFLKVRSAKYNCKVRLAARFIYLNKTCFNGLYRVNRKGQFNVPIGSYKNPKICDEENIRATSEYLKRATIKACSFEAIKPSQGDLIYCDPPYYDTFTGYTKKGFDKSLQYALRDCCVRWREKGAHVIVSNSNNEFIRFLYEDFDLHEVQASRNINCNGNGRAKTTELLIVGRAD